MCTNKGILRSELYIMYVINKNIYIDNDLLKSPLVHALIHNKRLVIVSDSIVANFYFSKLVEICNYEADLVILEPGEQNKTWNAVAKILKILAKSHDRHSVLVSLGGGMISDLCGFAASIYMRGISLVHIPTTLLAQVDAAIGGKTGCNFMGVKNLIGTYHDPIATIIDLSFLQTLPGREYIAGLAEVVKYGFILDAKFFSWLEVNKQDILLQKPRVLKYLIAKCCKIKSAVVFKDKYDKNQRMLLNFGHTFAHAIEAASGFTYLHGEAVALGMLIACRVAVKLGLVQNYVYIRLVKLIRDLGLYCKLDLIKCTPELLFNYIMYDKKRSQSKLNLILPCAIGQGMIVPNFEFANVEDFTKLCLNDSMMVIGDNV